MENIIKMKHIVVGVLFLWSCSTKNKVLNQGEGYYKMSSKNNQKRIEPVILGTVYDELGKPFGGATIQINDKGYYTANKLGKYMFNLPIGKHKVSAKNIGFKMVTLDQLKCDVGDTIRIDFFLKQDTIVFRD
jgi:hypothetical protein